MASLKAELDEIKKKFKELEGLKTQKAQIKSKKRKKLNQ